MFSLFQLGIYIPDAPRAVPTASVFDSVWFESVLFFLIGITLFWLLLMGIRAYLHHRQRFQGVFGTKVVAIRVPKEVKKEDANQEKSQQQVQELIARMETVFATIGGLRPQKGIKAWFLGRSDQLSFEMVLLSDKIVFFAIIPEKWQAFLEEQVHAQYPHAQIEEVPDYNIFSPSGVVLASYLRFRRPSHFPVRTYRKLESDGMNSLTNALSKIEEGDGASIQYIIRPAKDGWRKRGMYIAREMQQGKKLSDVERGNVWKHLFKEAKSFATTPKDPNKPKDLYRLSPLEEEMVKGLEEKASKAGLEVNIRIVVSAKTPDRAQRYLNDILTAYSQFNIYEYGNSFKKDMPRFQHGIVEGFIYRLFSPRHQIIMNAEELATLFHLPLPTTETPKIDWLMSRKAPPPANLPTEGVFLGLTRYRGETFRVKMKQQDRRRHAYVIGKSGSGKTEFIKSMIKQDIEEGRGVCLIDPHGDFAVECLELVPKHRAEDVIFFDPSDFERPMGLNMLEFDPRYPHLRTFVINEMLKIFDKLYDLKATGGPMFETYMRNAILLLMDHPESGMTLMDIPRVLADEEYRNLKLSHCQSQEVKDFWTKEALKAGGESSLANMVPYITSKLASFIYNDYMRPIVGQQKSAFNLFDAMNEQKIILMKLSKGKIGDLNAYLLGMIMVGKILDAALKRGDMDPKDRKDFYLYIDEFQNFLTDSISVILSEARKYALNLVIAHQFIGQLTTGASKDTSIRDAIFGNVGSMFAFRIGSEDADFLEKEFAPVFTAYDLINVEAFTCNAKLLIDNTASRPFNMAPQMVRKGTPQEKQRADLIRQLSRQKYGQKRSVVEADIAKRRAMSEPTPKAKPKSPFDDLGF